MHRVLLCQTMSPADGLAAYAIAGNIRRPKLAARKQASIDFAISKLILSTCRRCCLLQNWVLRKEDTRNYDTQWKNKKGEPHNPARASARLRVR